LFSVSEKPVHVEPAFFVLFCEYELFAASFRMVRDAALWLLDLYFLKKMDSLDF
jgi:hypothetical protein